MGSSQYPLWAPPPLTIFFCLLYISRISRSKNLWPSPLHRETRYLQNLLNFISGLLITTSQDCPESDVIKNEPTASGRFRNWLPALLPPVEVMRPNPARGSSPPHTTTIAHLNTIVNRTQGITKKISSMQSIGNPSRHYDSKTTPRSP